MASVQWRGQSLAPKNEAASAMGCANPSRNTKPEVRLRQALHRLGMRFRKHYRIVDGLQRPPEVDIVFTGVRLAVNVHGSFWHGKKKEYKPIHNSQYWVDKFAYNQRRDRIVARRVRKAGWFYVVVWDDWPLTKQVREVTKAYERAKERVREVEAALPGDGQAGVNVVQAPGLQGRRGGHRGSRAGAVDGVQRVAA
jgi:DNA mismatch endonuclease (patch repair protein)